jgi:hypothetical protein
MRMNADCNKKVLIGVHPRLSAAMDFLIYFIGNVCGRPDGKCWSVAFSIIAAMA